MSRMPARAALPIGHRRRLAGAIAAAVVLPAVVGTGAAASGATGSAHRSSATAPAAVAVPAAVASHALSDEATKGLVTGNATHFDGLGSPYGGCGLPQSVLETQDFVALNVLNTPRDYSAYTRPLPASMGTKIGMWNNGLNCGRWVKVVVSDYCKGINDGAPNADFCRNGSWVKDSYNGAVLKMIVADSCADSNAWCRDDPYHLDLATASLSNFVKAGKKLPNMEPTYWNNRHISWKFISAPNYSGDIQIGFLKGSQPYWAAVAINHLRNGIHGLDYWNGTAWVKAEMDADMGQAYLVLPVVKGGSEFKVRVYNVKDRLINGGRVYTFSLPCGGICGADYSKVTYTTSRKP